MKRNSLLLVALLFSFTTAFSQLGIRVGVNMANEISKFGEEDLKASFSDENLTGFQAGLVYETNREGGLGLEMGVLFAQKGSMFKIDHENYTNNIVEGYNEINYFEVPLNLKYKMNILNPVSIFGLAGVYGGFAITEKSEVKNKIDILKDSRDFDEVVDRIDFGFNLGLGVELMEKLQVAFNWSQALQKKDGSKKMFENVDKLTGILNTNLKKQEKTNRVFSVSVTYFF